jgi:hypothetical protein
MVEQTAQIQSCDTQGSYPLTEPPPLLLLLLLLLQAGVFQLMAT